MKFDNISNGIVWNPSEKFGAAIRQWLRARLQEPTRVRIVPERPKLDAAWSVACTLSWSVTAVPFAAVVRGMG